MGRETTAEPLIRGIIVIVAFVRSIDPTIAEMGPNAIIQLCASLTHHRTHEVCTNDPGILADSRRSRQARRSS